MKRTTLGLRMLSVEQAERAAAFLQAMIRKNYKMVTAAQVGRVTKEDGKRGPGLGLYLQFEKEE